MTAPSQNAIVDIDPKSGMPLYMHANAFTTAMPLTSGLASMGTGMGKQFMSTARTMTGPQNIFHGMKKTLLSRKPGVHGRILGRGLLQGAAGTGVGLLIGLGIDRARARSRMDTANKMRTHGMTIAPTALQKTSEVKSMSMYFDMGYRDVMQKFAAPQEGEEPYPMGSWFARPVAGAGIGALLGGLGGGLLTRGNPNAVMHGANLAGILGSGAGMLSAAHRHRQWADKLNQLKKRE